MVRVDESNNNNQSKPFVFPSDVTTINCKLFVSEILLLPPPTHNSFLATLQTPYGTELTD